MRHIKSFTKSTLFFHLLVLTAVFSTFFMISVHLYRGAEERYIQSYSSMVLEFVAIQQESIYSRVITILNLWVADLDGRNAGRPLCNSPVVSEFTADKAFANFWISGLDGVVLCTHVPTKETLNVSDREYFKQVLKAKKLTVGDFSVGRATGKNIVIFAAPHLDKNNAVRHILAISLDLDWAKSYFDSLGLLPGTELLILDSNGVVNFFVSDNHYSIGQEAFDKVILGQITSGKSGTFETNTHIYTYRPFRPFSNTDLKLVYQVIGVPRQPVLFNAGWIFMGISSGVLSIVVLYYFFKRLNPPS